MEVFFGSEKIVSYVPRTAKDEALANQATDYANYIIREDNDGFLLFYSAIKDALLKKAGIFKTSWEEVQRTEVASFTGLDENTLAALAQDAEIVSAAPREVMTDAGPVTYYDAVLRKTVKDGRVKIRALPPEEFLINRTANDLRSARFTAHRSYPTVSDLVALGYKLEDVEEHAGDETDFNDETQARNPNSEFKESSSDPSQRKVLYHECYMLADKNGDGIAERLKVCAIGDAYKILHVEEVSEHPFDALIPDPEPHTFFGGCPGDDTRDIQYSKSMVFRAAFDSLAQSVHPRMGVLDGQVNLADALNNEVGGIIRMRQPNAIFPIETQANWQQALPMLEVLDGVKESRTGQTKASMGLDPDALQSTTKAAVSGTLAAAQQRQKLICRVFAETGFKGLFRTILKLITRHQDQPRMVRLRDTFVQIDPRGWDSTMDVVSNVGLGTGNTEERLAFLTMQAAKQEQAIQIGGPDNPLCSLQNLYNTYAKIAEIGGYQASLFWKDPSLAPQQPQKPPEDPNASIAQAEVEKARINAQVEMQKALMLDARERDKLQADIALRSQEMALKYQVKLDTAALQADAATAQNEMQNAQPY